MNVLLLLLLMLLVCSAVEEELEGFVIIDDGCNCKREDAFPTCDCVRETLKTLLSAVDNNSISVVRSRARGVLLICILNVLYLFFFYETNGSFNLAWPLSLEYKAKPRGHNSQALLLLSKLFPSLIDDVIAA